MYFMMLDYDNEYLPSGKTTKYFHFRTNEQMQKRPFIFSKCFKV